MSRWPAVAIGEVADPVDRSEVPLPGVTYRQVGVRLWGEGAYERESMDGAATKYKTLNRVESGDIIVNKIWARNGSVSVVTPPLDGCFCSGEFPLFQPRTERLDPQWFYWITKTRGFWDACDRQSRGTSGKNRLRPQRFLEITIPLAPIEEQRRVVRRIEQFATLQLRAARMSVDAESKTSRLLPTAIDKLLHGRLEELPSGWNRIRVGDLGCPGVDTVQTGPFGAQLHKSDYRDEGHPVLAIGNVQWGFLDHSHVDHVSGDKATDLARYALAEGDVLFTRTGTVGRSAVVPPLADGWLMTGHILRIRLDKCRALPRFVFLAMQGCSSVRSQIEEGARGATRAGFNTSLLSRIELPMPSIGEQEAIVRRLQILESRLGLVGRLQDSVSASYDALVHSALGTLLGR